MSSLALSLVEGIRKSITEQGIDPENPAEAQRYISALLSRIPRSSNATNHQELFTADQATWSAANPTDDPITRNRILGPPPAQTHAYNTWKFEKENIQARADIIMAVHEAIMQTMGSYLALHTQDPITGHHEAIEPWDHIQLILAVKEKVDSSHVKKVVARLEYIEPEDILVYHARFRTSIAVAADHGRLTSEHDKVEEYLTRMSNVDGAADIIKYYIHDNPLESARTLLTCMEYFSTHWNNRKLSPKTPAATPKQPKKQQPKRDAAKKPTRPKVADYLRKAMPTDIQPAFIPPTGPQAPPHYCTCHGYNFSHPSNLCLMLKEDPLATQAMKEATSPRIVADSNNQHYFSSTNVSQSI